MGSLEEINDGDYVEAQLLTDPVSQAEDEETGDFGRILYRASFTEMEDSYVNYDTVQWILISLLLILVYGVGILMLLYVPIRRYVVRQDIRTRKLYVTANAIVYKVTRPVFLPCFGVSKREKHVFLHLVTDVVVEQGCLQSSYGVSSIRIEGMAAHSRPAPGDDVRIQGVTNAPLFKRIVLNAVSNLRKGKQASGENVPISSGMEDSRMYETPPEEPSRGPRHSQHWAWRPGVAGLTSWQVAYSPSLPVMHNNNDVAVNGESILRRLDGIEASVKRLEVLIGSQQQVSSPQQASVSEESTLRRADTAEIV
ncbi:unnamed protein product [Calypogeia fissa]